jgi:hypothetical protein
MQTAYKIGYLAILVRIGQCLTGCAEFGRGYENARLQSVALCANLSRNRQVSFFDALSEIVTWLMFAACLAALAFVLGVSAGVMLG